MTKLNWKRERITLKEPYGGDSMMLHLSNPSTELAQSDLSDHVLLAIDI